MSEAKHTKGPWTVDVLPKGQARRVFTERVEIWQGNSARLIACMHHKNWSIDGSSDLANARLITAAPDLFDAAQAAWNCIAELPPTQARVEVAQMLQAAIEKASGGANG